MPREDIGDLLAFLAVAREQSFTRAAAKLSVSQSALSHTISRFEMMPSPNGLSGTQLDTSVGSRALASVSSLRNG